MARAVAIANTAAVAKGISPGSALITVFEEAPPPKRVWKIHYGPRELILKRGGDLTVLVDESAGNVLRVIQGQ